MSEQIKELFSTISPTYDRLNHLLSFNLDKRWRKQTIQTIRASENAPLLALDLCAGTFDLSLAFLERFRQSKVISADFSHGMLKAGLNKIKPHSNRIFPVCGDALKLPFPDQSFDVVFCGYGFRNLDDPAKGLAEIHRVLKPGGQILILEFFRPQKLATRVFHHTYGRWVLPNVGHLISKSRSAYLYLHDSISRFYTLNECEKAFEKQGFNEILSKRFFMGVTHLVSGRRAA